MSPSPAQKDAGSLPIPPPLAYTPNVGRKRGCITPLLRSGATPGHNANMQKIFLDAKAHLKLDMTFASSPAGSIESRLPSAGTPSLSRVSSQMVSLRQDDGNRSTQWRYSTAPGLLAQAHIDVREPFPENEPLLPDLSGAVVQAENTPGAEPVSSGFNNPEDHDMEVGDTEHEVALPPLPDTKPLASRSIDIAATDTPQSSSSPSQNTPLLTDLEGPLTELNVSHTCQSSADDDSVSPAIAYLQRHSVSPEALEVTSRDSGGQPIFLSTSAKEAAESARAKRGLLGSSLRSTSDKENVPPGMICPDPYAHTNPGVSQCPDPRRHTMYPPRVRMSTPSTFGRSSGHTTPNPYLHSHGPSPSPFRATLYPPAPHLRRADSSGSPFPVQKLKSPPTSQRQTYFSSGPGEFAQPPTAIIRPPTGSGQLPTEHFQPGWYQFPSTETEVSKPKSLNYSFSTAAAKVIGQSPAPELRIRDSYRTDTLTPFARPASRYRKNGIGAIAARGAARPFPPANYSPWPSTAGPGNFRPGTGPPPSQHGMASPDAPRFMSSPPKQSEYSACMPTKRRRPKAASRDFDIAEDTTSLPGTPMEIDEDIQAAVRMSIVGIPDQPTEDVPRLSPNVTPYRKGKGIFVKRPRTASYWDHDLPEVRRIDNFRGKRPATMEAGTHRVKSMRVSGIRSSPRRMPVAGRAGTVGSASIYSQAGLSEMSRPETKRGMDVVTGSEEIDGDDAEALARTPLEMEALVTSGNGGSCHGGV